LSAGPFRRGRGGPSRWAGLFDTGRRSHQIATTPRSLPGFDGRRLLGENGAKVIDAIHALTVRKIDDAATQGGALVTLMARTTVPSTRAMRGVGSSPTLKRYHRQPE
jgi:hypothetical protein